MVLPDRGWQLWGREERVDAAAQRCRPRDMFSTIASQKKQVVPSRF